MATLALSTSAARGVLAPRKDAPPFRGIPVEYKGGSIPPPDQRRSYN